jgi:RNA polymerase sigma-70 factor (ECF subfamily)
VGRPNLTARASFFQNFLRATVGLQDAIASWGGQERSPVNDDSTAYFRPREVGSVADSSLQTRASLLLRLRQTPPDQEAWAEFVDRYGRRIHAWCQRWGLQEADAQDVTQTVLLQLASKLQTFSYDPTQRFRAWLKTVTQHAWSDFLAARRPGVKGSGDSGLQQLLDTVQARDDLTQRLQEAFDQELVEVATTRVRARVEERTWEAYRLAALEGLSGAETAARLGMQVGTVYKAKSKVQAMLQDVIGQLQEETPA